MVQREPSLKRLADWPSRLDVYLRATRDRPFCWGTLDCVLFAAGAVEAMTGTDPVPGLAGSYDAPRGAWDTLQARYGGDLETATAKVMEGLGQHRVDVKRAGRGDVVLAEAGDGRDALGICLGKVAVFHTARGHVYVPRPWLAAWRV